MNGKLWKDEIVNGLDNWSEDRCLFLEMNLDLAVCCGCYKYISIYDDENTLPGTVSKASTDGFVLHEDNLYDICNKTGAYVSSPYASPL
jgi:hypothetical protein